MQKMVRLITCGSVDDGKSTLIGRLLWESKHIYEDHIHSLKEDSVRYGTQGNSPDLALLLDGLQAEREQNITIDVAYRFFSTARRRFLIADTPGHEQYTRNMATAASNSDVAVLVVNASKGLTTQTHRHTRIAGMMGIHHLVLVINKMDVVDWDEACFSRIAEEFEPLVRDLGFKFFCPIPISALNGDNVITQSKVSPWYKGPTLLALLEEVEVAPEASEEFRMAVQFVNRPNQNFRGYCGRIASGEVKVGDRVRIVPGGIESRVQSIVVWQRENISATAGDSITLCFDKEIDISRGSVVTAAAAPVELSDQFEVKLLCFSDQSVVSGRTYQFQLHTCVAAAMISTIKYKIDPETGSHLAAKLLAVNEIGVATIAIDRLVPFEPYERCRRLGSFILVDRLTNETVGAGMIDFPLRRASNIHWQAAEIQKVARAAQKLQKPMCLWFTGLPASGKSTIADLLERCLFAAGRHTYILDGDNVRHGLSRDLGFTEVDRVENIRRVAEVARLMVDAGLVVIVAFISPYRTERFAARSRFEPGEFVEIFVDTPLTECERRDPKGLYAKARRGELLNFTGIDSQYEPPTCPEIRLDTTVLSCEECVNNIFSFLGWNFTV